MAVSRVASFAALMSLAACAQDPGAGTLDQGALGSAGVQGVPRAGDPGGAGAGGAPTAGDGDSVGMRGDAAAVGLLGDGGFVATDSGAGVDVDENDAAVQVAPGAAQTLTIDGQPVTVHLPSFGDPTYAAPVVFSLHGLSVPSAAMADITGLPALADKEGFIAVFPEGVGGSWNTGGSACGLGSFAGNTADDYTYLQHILDAVEKLQPIDRERVFVSGFSMGGYASNALACNHPETFRAAAPASGGAPAGPCSAEIIPVMIFHGTNDGTIAHDCGVQARAAWVKHNGCSTEVDAVPVMGGTCEWSQGCPKGGQVVFCSYQGMGHGWAGSVNPFALGGTQFESATALMWDFFKGG